MKRLTATIAGLTTSLVILLDTPVHAHGLATNNALDGLTHPLLGLDHVLMLVAVGTVASLISAQILLWALAGAVIGAVLGSLGLTLPAAEVLAALAISAVGGLILAIGNVDRKSTAMLPKVSGAAVAIAIALHAMLHGLEAPQAGSTGLWWSGALASSALICGATYVLLKQLPQAWTRWIAMALMILGLGLALGPLGLLSSSAGV